MEAEQDGRIYIERINATFLKADGNEFRAGIERAIALGWLHESGTYLKFTDSGAALFA